jgi:DcmR-like sensory protein
VTNIVPFPSLASAPGRPGRHLAARFLERPPLCSHAVQFYDDADFLVETVAEFMRHGLDAGHSVLAIATPEHTDGIIERLGRTRVASALDERRLVLADADALLARFMVGGEISVPAFTGTIDLVMRDLPEAAAGGPLRAFGEMVDRLWQQGLATAALQLEEVWCRLCEERQLSLLCGYAMQNFYRQDESPRFHEVCRLHSHVLPTEKFARQPQSDFDRLREISLLEQRERLLEGEVFYREQLERALRELARNTELARAAATPPAAPGEQPATLRSAARELLEPATEILRLARELASRQPAGSAGDDISRLSVAVDRLQHAAARLELTGVAAGPREVTAGPITGSARRR